MTARRIIGCTEPSYFTTDVISTIEKFFDANPLKLCQNEVDDLYVWLDMCDAVILAGGADIHPRLYGCAVLNEYGFSKFDVRRDYRELRIIHYCFQKGIPILGICRGHQMLGVYHNIKLICDLSDGVLCHQPAAQKISHNREEPMHWVCLLDEAHATFEACEEGSQILPGSISAHSRYLWVNSFHHQGLWYLTEAEEKKRQKEVGADYKPAKWRRKVEVLGYAAGVKKRRIIELMRGKTNDWLSCQWHPEYDWEQNAASKMILTRFGELIEKGKAGSLRSKKRRVSK